MRACMRLHWISICCRLSLLRSSSFIIIVIGAENNRRANNFVHSQRFFPFIFSAQQRNNASQMLGNRTRAINTKSQARSVNKRRRRRREQNKSRAKRKKCKLKVRKKLLLFSINSFLYVDGRASCSYFQHSTHVGRVATARSKSTKCVVFDDDGTLRRSIRSRRSSVKLGNEKIDGIRRVCPCAFIIIWIMSICVLLFSPLSIITIK